MEKGLTIQFTNKVTSSPLGRRPTSRIEAKSTFIIMGMIMSQSRMAIGTLIWLFELNSIRRKESMAVGKNFPTKIPTTMQTPTQRLK
jgi:hypothetical protein